MAFTTPTTWIAGTPLTAAQLNQQVSDNISALSTWQDYTPNLGGATGSFTYARAIQAGGLVHVRFRLVLSGSAPTNVITISTPSTMAYSSADTALGTAVAVDGGVGSTRRSLTVVQNGAVSVFFIVDSLTGSATVAPTVPWTWAVGDSISGTFTYEAA